MKTFVALISPLFIGCVISASSDVGKSYHVYHKLGDSSTMTSRGHISIAPSDEENNIGLVAKFHPDNSAQLDTTSFDAMVEKGDLYTIIILEDEGDSPPPVSSYPPQTGSQFVSASVPGCSIRRSNLREEISLSISPTGKLMSVFYRPIISPLAPKTCHHLKPLSKKPETIFGKMGGETNENSLHNNSMPFKTSVSFDSHTPMMVVPAVLTQQRPPPGLKWYRRNSKNNPSPLMGGAKQEGGGGIPGVDDEPPTGFRSSFLYKYWYIVLPMAMVVLFGGGDEGEVNNTQRGAAPQSSGTAAAAAAAAVGAGAVAAGGAAHVPQRRGKRD
ncbi:hypothetical protein ACHAXH_009582 [Discostella pseudostelligera]